MKNFIHTWGEKVWLEQRYVQFCQTNKPPVPHYVYCLEIHYGNILIWALFSQLHNAYPNLMETVFQ